MLLKCYSQKQSNNAIKSRRRWQVHRVFADDCVWRNSIQRNAGYLFS